MINIIQPRIRGCIFFCHIQYICRKRVELWGESDLEITVVWRILDTFAGSNNANKKLSI